MDCTRIVLGSALVGGPALLTVMNSSTRSCYLFGLGLILTGCILWFTRSSARPSQGPEDCTFVHQDLSEGNGPAHLSSPTIDRKRSVGETQVTGATVTVPADPTPIPTIGRVIDLAGSPIANATVSVSEWKNILRANAGFPVGNEAVLTTDENGRFRCFPKEEEWSVFVEKAGFGSVLRSGSTLVSANPDWNDLGDVVLPPGGVVSGTVLDENNIPISGAKIAHSRSTGIGHRVPPGSFFTVARTDIQGRFTVEGMPLGDWSLAVHHPDYIPGMTGGTLSANEPKQSNVEVRLASGASIEGFVVGLPEGEGVHSVSLRPAVDEYNEDTADSYGYDRGARRLAIGAGGHIQAGGLMPEQLYWLDLWTGLTPSHGTRRRSARVSAQAGTRDVRLVFEAGFRATLQLIHGETGEPILNVLSICVEYGDAHDDLIPPEDPTLPGGAGWRDGIIHVEDLIRPHEGAPLSVRVYDGRFEEYNREYLESPSKGQLDLGMVWLNPTKELAKRPSYRASVRVVSSDGRALSNVSIEVDPPPLDGKFRSAWTNEQGVANLKSSVQGMGLVRPALDTLVAERQTGVANYLTSRVEKPTAPIEFQSGELEEVELKLPVRADLELRVGVGPVGPIPASVLLSRWSPNGSNEIYAAQAKSNNRRTFKVDEAKSIRFRDLYAGSWNVCLKDKSGHIVQVHRVQLVPGPQVLSLSFEPRLISGRVLDGLGNSMGGALVLLSKESRYFHTSIESKFRSHQLNRALIADDSSIITQTADDGTWSLCSALPEGPYVVHAVERGYVRTKSEAFTLSTGPLQLADAMLRKSGSIRIFLAEGVSEPWIKIAPADWSLKQAFEVDEHGYCDFLERRGVIRGLKPGPWKLYWRPEGAETIQESRVYPFEVVEGEFTEVHLSDS